MNYDMSLNPIGFTVAMICLGLLVVQFVCHRWIKKVTKYYWFWLSIGLFLTIWMLSWRLIPYIIQYIDLVKTEGYDPVQHAGEISNCFCLDLCVGMGVALPLSLVVDPSRKVARALAPLALAGSIFVCFGQFSTGGSGFEFGAKYLFIGDDSNRLYAWMHITNLFLGFGVLLNTPKYGWKGYLTFLTAAAIYYSYVGICIPLTGATRCVSGLLVSEWAVDGPYGWVATVSGFSPVACMSFGFPVIFIGISLIPYLNDHVIKRFRQYLFGNARTNKWYVWNAPNVFVKE